MKKSDNEKGNPYHDEDGKFTSAGNQGSGSKADSLSSHPAEHDDDSLGTIEFKKAPKIRFDSGSIVAFLGKMREKKDKEAQEFLDKNGVFLNEESKSYYAELSIDDKRQLLLKSPNEYKKSFLQSATDKEIEALTYAEALKAKGNQLDQQIATVEAKIKTANDEIQSKLDEFDKENFVYLSGIWYSATPTLKDYAEKSEKGPDGLSSIDKKKQFLNEILNDADKTDEQKQDAKEKILNLEKFEKLGEEYEKLKASLTNKAWDDGLLKLNEELGALKKERNFIDFKGLSKIADAYIEKFQDPEAAYSQARKNKALWITPKWAKEHGFPSVSDAAYKYLGDKFEKMWANMTSSEQHQLIDYTGSGYSKYNRPLRGLYHSGWKGFGFANGVTRITEAIDKCVWDEDMWVQRGINDSKMFRLPGSDKLSTVGELTDGQLQSLVGTTFIDNGFMSCGAGKGTGFSSNVMFNFYCPKGTKGAYMNTKGSYSGSNENEIILQRGYEYRITKIERKGYTTYIDCDVIVGSDKNKETDIAKLKAIGEKYLQ